MQTNPPATPTLIPTKYFVDYEPPFNDGEDSRPGYWAVFEELGRYISTAGIPCRQWREVYKTGTRQDAEVAAAMLAQADQQAQLAQQLSE